MSELMIEKVKPEDKDEIIELSSKIWEGHDYIPKVFDDWAADGGFYKGVLKGKIVGVDKYTRHSEKVIWLEGLRVHPEYQKKGYGREIAEGVRDILEEEEDYEVLRFMTAKGNVESIHMAEKAGFEKVVDLYSLRWRREEGERRGAKIGNIEMVEESRMDEVWEMIRGSDEFRENGGFYIPNWTAYDMDKELVKREIEKKKCFGFFIDGGLDALSFYDLYEPYDIITIPFICGSGRGVRKLIWEGLHLVEVGEHEYLGIKTGSERIKAMALELGLEITDHEKALIYELRS
ncbi:MAG: GNAT family N-acetyltransferase [Thermoplasmata archaeon]